MKYLKSAYLLALISIIFTISGCSAIRLEKSKFDGSLLLTMENRVLDNDTTSSIQLNWDATMPENTSLGKITLYDQHITTSDTRLNISADGEKFKVELIDTNKESSISTSINYMTGRSHIDSANYLYLYFYIPDNVLDKVSKSDNAIFMLNFANKENVILELRITRKLDMKEFYEHKSKLKSSTQQTKSTSLNSAAEKTPETRLQQPPKVKSEPEVIPQRSNPASSPSMTISSNNANLRTAPSKNAEIIIKMQKGQEVNFIKQKDEWIMVELTSGEVGWCHKSLLAQK